MKKTFVKPLTACALAAVLAFSAAGCGGSDTKEADGQGGTGQTEAPAAMEAPLTMEFADKTPLEYKNGTAIPLWENKEDMPYYDSEASDKNTASITPYIAEDNANGGCVIICPGGGYSSLATKKEGTVPAEAFNEQGISAFVLQYRIAPYDYQAMLADVCRAVRFVRYYAEDFGIAPDKVAIMGFSAGGHLASMNLEHAGEDTQAVDEMDQLNARAGYGILCYPVISLSEEYGHEMSTANFLGEENADDQDMAEKYSAELGVTEDMPPCFIWHCKGDTFVPYENSQMFADAMKDAGAECELHLYEGGEHGLGIAAGDDAGEAKEWFGKCVEWLQGKGF